MNRSAVSGLSLWPSLECFLFALPFLEDMVEFCVIMVRNRLSALIMFYAMWVLVVNSDRRAGDVRFRMIPILTPTGGSYVGGMVAQGVSKNCIFNEDFGHILRHPKKLSKRLLVKHWIVIPYVVSCCLLP